LATYKGVYNPLNNSLRKLKENPTKFLACRGKMKEKKWSAKWSANGVQLLDFTKVLHRAQKSMF